MKYFRITAANKKHFESLIKDYREDGYMIVIYGYMFVALEKDDAYITIEY